MDSYLMPAIIYYFFSFIKLHCANLLPFCVLQGKSGTPGTMGPPGPPVGNACCKQITRAVYIESHVIHTDTEHVFCFRGSLACREKEAELAQLVLP